ncbi:hypothetical protein ACU686_11765 [Yinghuangia aomiensis]
MDEFAAVVLAFPAVVFTFALVVVVAFWLCVLVGAVEHDSFEDGSAGDVLGLGGVPPTVSVVAVGRHGVGAEPRRRSPVRERRPFRRDARGRGRGGARAAVAAAWLATRVVLHPLRRRCPRRTRAVHATTSSV